MRPAEVVQEIKNAGLQTYPAFDSVQEELVGFTEEELVERDQMLEYPNGFRGGLVPGDGISSDSDPGGSQVPTSWVVKVQPNSLMRARFFLDGSLRTYLVGQFIEPSIQGNAAIVAPIQVASIGVNVVEMSDVFGTEK